MDIFSICPSIFKNIKYGREVLGKLVKSGLIAEVTVPLFFHTRGAGHAFYTLSRNGYQLINGDAKGFKKKSIVSHVHMMHYYLKNTFLTGLESHPEFEVGYSDIEIQRIPALRDCFIASEIGTDTAIIPDFLIKVGNTLFIGEVDTETETIRSHKNLKTIEQKFEVISRIDIAKLKAFFDCDALEIKYLHVTTGEGNRIRNLAKVVIGYPSLPTVLLTTSKSILPEITYDKNRYPSISYENLLKGQWLSLPSGTKTSLTEELDNE